MVYKLRVVSLNYVIGYSNNGIIYVFTSNGFRSYDVYPSSLTRKGQTTFTFIVDECDPKHCYIQTDLSNATNILF